MPDEEYIQRILDEMLESNRTPEEVCAGDPELLEEVRLRWERIQYVKSELDELFPSEPTEPTGIHESPPVDPKVGILERLIKLARRHPVISILIAIFFALLVVIIGNIAWIHRNG